MKWLKIIFSITIAIICLFWGKTAHAQDSFYVSTDVEYRVLDTGITHVTHAIDIENLDSEVYAPEFVIHLDNINPDNIVAFQDGTELLTRIESSENGQKIVVVFDKAVVGRGKKHTFTLEFEDSSFASRSGEVWEISIPRLGTNDDFDSYKAKLIVPKTLGAEAYVSPEPLVSNETDEEYSYEYDKNLLSKSGITAGFGGVQVFSFSLAYHLENPLKKESLVTIAIPPDTSTQRVNYSEISPEPQRIYLDIDGNWIAEYMLKPRQRVDVSVQGTVEVFSLPKPSTSTTSEALAQNLAATTYWQTENPMIQQLASELQTPRAIYDYVVATLSYDYNRVRPDIERVGAVGALRNPDAAICMEFTDFFIALARASGIPAREINGYAYTENPEIEPLSLVADVLHSWPEYWNEEEKVWVPVDPTWGKTTGGVDYFEKLDLRHVAFVIHGQDDTTPFPAGSYKLGANPQKDVYVSFGQAPPSKRNDIEVTGQMSPFIPFARGSVKVQVTNYGPRAEYNLPVKVGYKGTDIETKYIEVLPPYGIYEFETELPHSFWGTSMSNSVSVSAKQAIIDIPTNRNMQVLINVTALIVILVLIVLGFFIKIGKITLPSWKR